MAGSLAVAAVVVAIAKRRALETGLWSGRGRRLPKVLLVLLRRARVEGVVARVVRARRQLVEGHRTIVELEQLDAEDAAALQRAHRRARHAPIGVKFMSSGRAARPLRPTAGKRTAA